MDYHVLIYILKKFLLSTIHNPNSIAEFNMLICIEHTGGMILVKMSSHHNENV